MQVCSCEIRWVYYEYLEVIRKHIAGAHETFNHLFSTWKY